MSLMNEVQWKMKETGSERQLNKCGLKNLARTTTTKDLLLGTALIENKLLRYNDIDMRRQLDAVRKHLAMEIKLKFP